MAIVAVIAGVLLVPFELGDDRYLMSLLVLSAIWGILAVSVSMLFRSTGLLSMAHGAFFGIGGYAVGILSIHNGTFWLALPVGIASCVVLGMFVGLATLRLRSHYFAVTTLSLSLVVQAVISNWSSLTQGALGIPSIPPPAAIALGPLQVSFESGGGMYYLVVVALVVVLAVSITFVRSPFGKGCAAVRDNELLAGFLGLDVRRYRLGAFVLSTAMAAVAGSLYAADTSYIDPTYASYIGAFQALVQGQVGGILSPVGPIVGALVLTLLPEALSELQDAYLLVYGVLLVLVILFFREGLVGLVRLAKEGVLKVRRRVRPTHKSLTSEPAIVAVAAPVILGVPGTEVASPSRSAPLLRCRDATVRYGGLTAISGVGFDVAAGELVAVVGPNGAGKSSLFNGITGATKLAEGTVEFDGVDVTGSLPHVLVRRGMVRTFQSAQLFDTLSVMENGMVARLPETQRKHWAGPFDRGRPATITRERREVAQLLRWVGLGDDLGRRANELPIGKKQRLAVAMALAIKPRLLLLDEPLAGLSDDAIPGMLHLFRSVRDQSIGIVLIEHRMRAVMAIADRVIVLDRGRKIAEGAPRDVTRDDSVVAAYLGTRYGA
jgi:branched-chain amino acid transport system permease protein